MKKIIQTIIALSFIPLIAHAQSATYTQAQVAAHNTASDCWIIVSGNVYSVGSYISMHPGGQSRIINECGKDATQAFNTRGGTGSHSSSARATLNSFLIGSLSATPVVTPPTPIVVTPTPTPTTPTPNATTTLTINQTYTLCTQSAIRKRDTALVSARSAYNTSMTVALDARSVAETAAVAIVDDTTRQDALIKAASTYSNQVKIAQDTLKSARQTALTTYNTDIKKCKSDKQLATTNSNTSKRKSSLEKSRSDDAESHESQKSTLRSLQEEYKQKVNTFKSFFKSEKSERSENKREGNDD